MGHRIITLPGVLYIPELARKLIYVSKMDDAGVKTMFEKETRGMVQGELVLLRGAQIRTLYNMIGTTISDGCNSSIVPNIGVEEGKNPTVFGEKTMSWLKRLGHVEKKGLLKLHGKGIVEGMLNYSLDLDFCEHFLYGKWNRVRFSSSTSRAGGILQLVHRDVFGPVTIPSLGKSMYYVSFIDDF
jgi:hypothetical protein